MNRARIERLQRLIALRTRLREAAERALAARTRSVRQAEERRDDGNRQLAALGEDDSRPPTSSNGRDWLTFARDVDAALIVTVQAEVDRTVAAEQLIAARREYARSKAEEEVLGAVRDRWRTHLDQERDRRIELEADDRAATQRSRKNLNRDDD